MTLGDLHEGWAWVVVLANGAVGIWALAAHRLVALRRRALWWAIAAAQVTVFVQVALGAAAMNADDLEPDDFHVFYGFVALIAIAILYAYRSQLQHRLHLLYGLGSLFVMGLAIRAMLIPA